MAVFNLLSSSNRKYQTFLLLSYLSGVVVSGSCTVIVCQFIHLHRKKAGFVSITTVQSMVCANDRVHHYPKIAFDC